MSVRGNKALRSLYYKPAGERAGVPIFTAFRDTGKPGRFDPVFTEGTDLLTLTKWAAQNGYQLYLMRGHPLPNNGSAA